MSGRRSEAYVQRKFGNIYAPWNCVENEGLWVNCAKQNNTEVYGYEAADFRG